MRESSQVRASRRASRLETRIISDNLRLLHLQSQLRTLGERSTFHGIDVLLETKPGCMRRLVILLLFAMCVLCVTTVSHLIAGFINMPISTVINNGQGEFTFPMITVCPDSPFSMEKIVDDETLKEIYIQSANFWIQKQRKAIDSLNWMPAEGYWRETVKRTFRTHFLKNRNRLAWDWRELVVSCEYGGRPCDLDEQPMEMPSTVMTWEKVVSDLGPDSPNFPGLVKEVSMVKRASLPSPWPDGQPNASQMITQQTPWPRGKVIVIEHPTKYLCFQLRFKAPLVKEPGSMRGLHLILQRPYNAKKTQPALLTVESLAPLLQAWDDRQFLLNPDTVQAKRDAKLATESDGFHVLLHQDTPILVNGSYPADDIYKASSSSSVFALSVRYGQQVSVSLGQFVYKRLSTVYRPCQKRMRSIHQFLEMTSFITSGGYARRYTTMWYTRDNCISQSRQKIIVHRCRCYSEDYLIPFTHVQLLLKLGFCHSPSSDVPAESKKFMERKACHDRVSELTREEVLDAHTPRSYNKPILIQLTKEVEHLWICPKHCREVITQAEIVQKLPMPTDLPATISGLRTTVNRSDLIAISMYANSARIPVISEGEQMNLFNLLASLGGTFGLYLGLSGVTVFEVLEALSHIIRALPALWRIWFRDVLAGCKKLATKRKRASSSVY